MSIQDTVDEMAPLRPENRHGTDPLMVLNGIRQEFPSSRGRTVHALDGVTLTVERGETLGIVGESGCGKSTLARAALLLRRPTSGEVFFDGKDALSMRGGALRSHRKRAQMVFQDPNDSLDPRYRVQRSVAEPLRAAGVSRADAAERAMAALAQVGVPEDAAWRHPHEFSGGQRQRIAIARAIATEPELVVLDEPTSALDVSIQAQILNLLLELQERQQLTYMFISHNLAVIRHLSHRVAVMYLGRIVEVGPAADVLANPLHPYTTALISAVPEPEATKRERIVLTGDLPSPASRPTGCAFASRCWLATEQCRTEAPPLTTTAMSEPGSGHLVACHRPAEAQEALASGLQLTA
ncbi:ABC transporter ATP-binding protein [Demequina sp. NBRC 110057]|uniref:ABC transporter ATP-binding protein n=1 Tax=Demequina sp. NBRC 110057 TaxID=1570346 RepID=UPI00190ED4D6|nr:oligopeptide/dipeptide ABC transporter ATP-binding protein [Demequina sp. NBRC 110057]